MMTEDTTPIVHHDPGDETCRPCVICKKPVPQSQSCAAQLGHELCPDCLHVLRVLSLRVGSVEDVKMILPYLEAYPD